jgi:hypothetical protein
MARDASMAQVRTASGSHPWRGGLSCREPALDLRDVALRIFCESIETSGAAERVLPFGSLEGEALLALLGHVDDHVADRVEHLSLVCHGPTLSESGPPPDGVAEISYPRTVFHAVLGRRKVWIVEQVARGPWERAGVDRETWYAVRMMAVAIRETARLPIDPTEKGQALPADHERLGEYADRLVSAVEDGDPEIVAMLLRRQSRSAG